MRPEQVAPIGQMHQYVIHAARACPVCVLRVYGDGGRTQARVRGRVPRAFMCTFHSISCVLRADGTRHVCVLRVYGAADANRAR
eukprot:133307-Prymnesium_polylepis.1